MNKKAVAERSAYESPLLEVIGLEIEDVITTSGVGETEKGVELGNWVDDYLWD